MLICLLLDAVSTIQRFSPTSIISRLLLQLTAGIVLYRAVGESASHRHVGLDIDNVYIFGWDVGSLTGVDFSDFTRKSNRGNRLTTGYTGGNGYHNNIAPCKAVYGWYRAN